MSSAEGRSFRELGGGALALVGLSAFAIAQPLFDLLGDEPQFFISRGSEGPDLLGFALALSLGVPALLVLPLALASGLGARVGRAAAAVLGAVLVGLVVLPACNRAGLAAGAGVALAGVAGAAWGLAYARFARLRSFARLLALAALLFPALFLFASPASRVAFSWDGLAIGETSTAADTPVIVLLFDLLPTTSLMTESRQVDAERFPAFADLARHSTWFRYASTVAPNTSRAVPAILTGNRPREGQLALAADHPANLFTWLAGSHDLHVIESETRLCPASLCGDAETPEWRERMRGMALDTGVVALHLLLPREWATNVPPINAQWHGFTDPERSASSKREERRDLIYEGRDERKSSGRVLKLLRFVAGLSEGSEPVLAYLHLPLPHTPFIFLPSGHFYVRPDAGPMASRLRGVGPNRHGLRGWGDSAESIRLGYQRMTLQIAYVDHLLGSVLARLRKLELFDRSLIVVVADHGMSFIQGGRTRAAEDGNTIFVPLFFKRPGQVEPVVDDRNAETVDVLPSLAELLDTELPRPVDGRSLFVPDDGSRRTKRVAESRSRRRLTPAGEIEHADWQALFERSLQQKLRLVGSGPIDRMYSLGPHGGLVGRRVSELEAGVKIGELHYALGPPVEARLRIDQRKALRSVEPFGFYLPAYLSGRLWMPEAPTIARDLVVALNGVVRTTTRAEREGRGTGFGAMLPHTALQRGANRVEVFAATAVSPGEILLQPLR